MPRSTGAMHFLVVEDNPVNQLLASEMLRALGYPVLTADDGVHAIESCRSDPPLAVLMDVQMPRLDGLATMRELRRLQAQGELPAFPIIVCSAFYAPAERTACFAAGADGFVTKPLMLAKLGAEIFRVLKGQSDDRPPGGRPRA